MNSVLFQRVCDDHVSRIEEIESCFPHPGEGVLWHSSPDDCTIQWVLDLLFDCNFSLNVDPDVYRFIFLLWTDYAQEESVSIDGLKKSEIAKALEELVKKGESMPRKSMQ